MSHENFTDALKLWKKNKIGKAKSSPYAFYKSLAKVSPNEIKLIIEAQPEKMNGLYTKKTALHWAFENSNSLSFYHVLDFYKRNSLSIDTRCAIKFYTQSPVNVTEYAFLKSKTEQLFMILSDFPDLKIECLFNHFSLFPKMTAHSNQEENDFFQNLFINQFPERNPLETAFWLNKPVIVEKIMAINFTEKKEWFAQLQNEIKFVFLSYAKITNQFAKNIHKKNIFETLVHSLFLFFPLQHISFFSIIDTLNRVYPIAPEIFNFALIDKNIADKMKNSFHSENNPLFHKHVIELLNQVDKEEILDIWNYFKEKRSEQTSQLPLNSWCKSIDTIILNYYLHKELHLSISVDKKIKL